MRLQHSLLPAAVQTSISVGASPSVVRFGLLAGQVVSGSSPVSVHTSFLLGVASTAHLYGYFVSQNALVAGNAAIPVGAITGQCATGLPTAPTAFTQSTPFAAGSGLQIFQQSALVGVVVDRTDALTLRVDLSSLPQLPAGTYTGTLVLQAEVF